MHLLGREAVASCGEHTKERTSLSAMQSRCGISFSIVFSLSPILLTAAASIHRKQSQRQRRHVFRHAKAGALPRRESGTTGGEVRLARRIGLDDDDDFTFRVPSKE